MHDGTAIAVVFGKQERVFSLNVALKEKRWAATRRVIKRIECFVVQ